MSMLATVTRLSDQHIEAIRRDPSCVADLLDMPSPSPAKIFKPGFFDRIFRPRALTPDPASVRVPTFSVLPDTEACDLNGCWHILHFLFTGTAWEGHPPRAFLASGGIPVGRDLGYGPPRFFDANEVRAIAAFLATLTPDELASRYDPSLIKAAEIYWDAQTTPASIEEDLVALWAVIDELRAFLAEAVRQEMGMLVEIY